MSCAGLLNNALPRISARTGQTVDLNVDFLNNGILTDPYAIRFVEIYKSQVLPHNLVVSIPVSDLDSGLYPAPVCQESIEVAAGLCGTEPTGPTTPISGKYHLPFLVPNDFEAPDIYFDVWYYYPVNPCSETGTCDLDDQAYAGSLIKCCHRFWVYPDAWFCDDRLQTVRFGFEPLDQKFYSPENRPLEVGLMPLPLYDYNYNLVNPMIPMLRPTITIETQYNELLRDNVTCEIGIRQGSYRSNPWVVKYNLDTSTFLKGTYRYYITLNLPDGSTRVSRKFIFTIS